MLFSLVTVLVTSSVVAFASEEAKVESSKEYSKIVSMKKIEMKEKMEEHLSQALSEGKISQEEYDKILDSSLEGKRFRFGNFNKEGIKELRFNKQKDKE